MKEFKVQCTGTREEVNALVLASGAPNAVIDLINQAMKEKQRDKDTRFTVAGGSTETETGYSLYAGIAVIPAMKPVVPA